MTSTNPQDRRRVALSAALRGVIAALIIIESPAKLHAQAPAGQGGEAVPPSEALFTSAQAVAGKAAYGAADCVADFITIHLRPGPPTQSIGNCNGAINDHNTCARFSISLPPGNTAEGSFLRLHRWMGYASGSPSVGLRHRHSVQSSSTQARFRDVTTARRSNVEIKQLSSNAGLRIYVLAHRPQSKALSTCWR